MSGSNDIESEGQQFRLNFPEEQAGSNVRRSFDPKQIGLTAR
jgi:hypothetical protein